MYTKNSRIIEESALRYIMQFPYACHLFQLRNTAFLLQMMVSCKSQTTLIFYPTLGHCRHPTRLHMRRARYTMQFPSSPRLAGLPHPPPLLPSSTPQLTQWRVPPLLTSSMLRWAVVLPQEPSVRRTGAHCLSSLPPSPRPSLLAQPLPRAAVSAILLSPALRSQPTVFRWPVKTPSGWVVRKDSSISMKCVSWNILLIKWRFNTLIW